MYVNFICCIHCISYIHLCIIKHVFTIKKYQYFITHSHVCTPNMGNAKECHNVLMLTLSINQILWPYYVCRDIGACSDIRLEPLIS